jgi:hypothetical protein
MRGVNHDGVRFWLARNQAAEYSIKDAHSRPSDEAVIKSLVRSIDIRCITPSQAIANDVNDSADNTAVIDARPAMGTWEVGTDTLKLCFG